MPAWAGVLVGALSGVAFILTAGTPLLSAIPSILGCGVLGLFFSLCQNKTTLLGYLLVGLFMGINCWIVTKLVLALPGNTAWPLQVKQHSSFLYCVVFGEILAICAILFSSMQGDAGETTLPKD